MASGTQSAVNRMGWPGNSAERAVPTAFCAGLVHQIDRVGDGAEPEQRAGPQHRRQWSTVTLGREGEGPDERGGELGGTGLSPAQGKYGEQDGGVEAGRGWTRSSVEFGGRKAEGEVLCLVWEEGAAELPLGRGE